MVAVTDIILFIHNHVVRSRRFRRYVGLRHTWREQVEDLVNRSS